MRGAAAIMLESVSGPKQARSERTLYRLLDAAEALIVEQGLGGLSIPAVARRPGSRVQPSGSGSGNRPRRAARLLADEPACAARRHASGRPHPHAPGPAARDRTHVHRLRRRRGDPEAQGAEVITEEELMQY